MVLWTKLMEGREVWRHLWGIASDIRPEMGEGEVYHREEEAVVATVCPGVVDLRHEFDDVAPPLGRLGWRGERGDHREVGPEAGQLLADGSEVLVGERVVHGEEVGSRVAVLEDSKE